MVVGAEPHQDEAVQGPARQVERRVGDAPGMALNGEVAFALRDLRQVELDDVGRLHLADEGRGFGVHEFEGRAKRLVPGDQAVEGPAQRGAVQRPAQAHRVAHVVGGALGVQLVQDPHAPLRERQRQGPRTRDGLDRRQRPGGVGRRAGGKLAHGLGHLLDRRVIEDLPQGELHPRVERIRDTIWVASSECPPRSKKFARMPKPDLPSTSLQMSSKADSIGDRGASRSSVDASASGLGRRLRSSFPLASARQLRQDHERARDHVVGQPGLQRRAQGAADRRALGVIT